MAFDGWKQVVFEAKTWFLRGEQAHVAHAFRTLRRGCGAAAKVGHRLMTAMGLDLNKRRRGAFNRLVMHAQLMIALKAALAFLSPPFLPPPPFSPPMAALCAAACGEGGSVRVSHLQQRVIDALAEMGLEPQPEAR